jgi:hypothetical protein
MNAPRPITVDDLYNEIKDALNYLGVRWGDKHYVKCCIADNKLVLSRFSKTIVIDINLGKEE